MTDLPTITERETLDGERTSFTLTEFESTTVDDNDRRYLLNIASRGSAVSINLHFTAEEWGQFRAMIANFGPGHERCWCEEEDGDDALCPIHGKIQRRPFDQAEFDAFRADPKRQALVSRILDEMIRNQDGSDLPPWADR